ncbi:MAG: response regulator [Bacteroidota bacterium]|nr:response regulator [Bacteroidota bacterium]
MPNNKVLFIDDDEAVLAIVSIVLEEEGIEVITSTTPAIIEEISRIKPNVILLDEWMGDKKGSEVCIEIKKIEAHANIPIILISAVNDLAQIAQECAADAFIEKPFDVEKLVSVVKSFL